MVDKEKFEDTKRVKKNTKSKNGR